MQWRWKTVNSTRRSPNRARKSLDRVARRWIPALEAFELTKEKPAVLERYGDSDFGRGALLARRLIAKGVRFGERFRMDLIADMFNLFNHTNILAVNQLCDPSAGTTCQAGQPSAAYDARQFQFAVKMSW